MNSSGYARFGGAAPIIKKRALSVGQSHHRTSGGTAALPGNRFHWDRVLVSRQGAKKENTRGAKRTELVNFAPFALQFLAPLRETDTVRMDTSAKKSDDVSSPVENYQEGQKKCLIRN